MFVRGWEHADLSARAGHHDTEDPGGDPGGRRTGLVGGRALRDLRTTVWKWRGRDDVHDRSHTPHRLQTTLTPAQEAVAVALRKALHLPLDDLLAVVRGFLNPHVARSGLDRCLRRHGRATCGR